MVKDIEAERSNGKLIIEALIGDGKISIWIPVMATNLYMIDRNGDINKIKAIHLRDLNKK